MQHIKYFGVGLLLLSFSGLVVYVASAIIYYGFWDEVLVSAFLIFVIYMGGRSYCMEQEAKRKSKVSEPSN